MSQLKRCLKLQRFTSESQRLYIYCIVYINEHAIIHRLCTTFWLSDSRCSIDLAIQEFLQDPSPCDLEP